VAVWELAQGGVAILLLPCYITFVPEGFQWPPTGNTTLVSISEPRECVRGKSNPVSKHSKHSNSNSNQTDHHEDYLHPTECRWQLWSVWNEQSAFD
jgi:hypothetical protein